MALFRSNWFLGLLCALLSVPGASQQVQPAAGATVGDTTAIAVANRSIAAMTGGNVIHDVVLQGTVQRGNKQGEVPVRLVALVGHQSTVEYGVSASVLRETRTEVNGQPRISTTISNVAVPVADPRRDVWFEAVWFYPALSILNTSNDPSIRFTYVDAPNVGGSPATHIRATRYFADADSDVNSVIGQLSATDFYISNQTYLPLAISFTSAPDKRTPVGAVHWILFGDYKAQQGFTYPTTIKEFVNGTLVNQITITSASFNTGLTTIAGVAN